MFRIEGLALDPEEMKQKMREDVISSIRNFLVYVALLRSLLSYTYMSEKQERFSMPQSPSGKEKPKGDSIFLASNWFMNLGQTQSEYISALKRGWLKNQHMTQSMA
ncbi:hypothetical protein STEG23_033594 [Scotinomys teguina]